MRVDAKPMDTLSSPPVTTPDSEGKFDSLMTRKRDLFLLRQRLTHRRLTGEASPSFHTDYLSIREEEEKINLEILSLEKRWEVRSEVEPRRRTWKSPQPTRQLRKWLNLLMIIALSAFILFFLLGR